MVVKNGDESHGTISKTSPTKQIQVNLPSHWVVVQGSTVALLTRNAETTGEFES